ncbi:Zeta toxin [compost metagenome]
MDRSSDVLPDEEHARILRDQVVPAHNLDLAASQQRPAAVILGGNLAPAKAASPGQPNSSSAAMSSPLILTNFAGFILDAGAWAADLLEATVSERKNLIFDTALSNGKWASESRIKDLQRKGYQVEVRVVATPGPFLNRLAERLSRSIIKFGGRLHVRAAQMGLC